MKVPKFYFFISLLFLASCSQLTVFHSARTEGKGNLSISPTVEGYGLLEGNNVRGGGNLGNVAVPAARVELSYGLTHNLDAVTSLSTSANLLTSLKYRFIGTNESPFSMAVMPGYEYQTSFNETSTNISRLHLPLIVTLYSSENIGFYAGPKYVLQVESQARNISFPGLFAGINIDRRIKYTIGAGAFLPYDIQTGSQGYLFEVGIAAKFPLFSLYD